MRIMCLNGWGAALHDRLVTYIQQTAPDVLCLQEVVHTPASDKEWLDYRDGDHVLPQRANMFSEISAVLPAHVATFCPAAQGVLWDGERSLPSQWGLATFVYRDYPIIGQIQGFVHKDFSPDSYGEHPRPRSAHGIRLFDFAKRWPVSILHTHGLRDPANGKRDTPDRAIQAERLAKLAEDLAGPGERLVVCGDFNIEPDSATFDTLARIGLRDLVTARGYKDTRTSLYRKPGRFADYMLVNNQVEIISFDVVAEPEVSDHRPLLLEI